MVFLSLEKHTTYEKRLSFSRDVLKEQQAGSCGYLSVAVLTICTISVHSENAMPLSTYPNILTRPEDSVGVWDKPSLRSTDLACGIPYFIQLILSIPSMLEENTEERKQIIMSSSKILGINWHSASDLHHVGRDACISCSSAEGICMLLVKTMTLSK